MSENLHDIDRLFSDGIEGYEDMPAEKVWHAVDASLDKSNVVLMKRKYNNLKKVAAALLLLLMSVGAYEIFKPKNNNIQTVSDNSSRKINNTGKQLNNSAADNNKVNNIAGGKTDANAVTEISKHHSEKSFIEAADTISSASGTIHAGKQNSESISKASDKTNTSAVTNNKNQSPLTTVIEEEEINNAANKSNTAKNKTRINIKSPVAQETGNDINTANETTGNINKEQWLIADNSPAATLARRINKAVTETAPLITTRKSPNAGISTLKVQKNMPLKFSIMPFAAPQFAFNTLKEDAKPGGPNQGPGGPPPPRPGRDNHKEQYKGDEETQTSFTTGVLAQMQFGKNWGVQSGITYTTKTITIEPKKIYARPDKDGQVKYVYDCSSGYSYLTGKAGTTPVSGDSINTASSKNSLAYVGIPLMINYKIAAGKLNIIPTAGTAINFLTKQKIQTELQQGASKLPQTVNKIEGLKPVYLNAVMGVAVEYDVSKRVAFNVMPAASFALTSINKEAAVKSYPNSFGIYGGVKIKF